MSTPIVMVVSTERPRLGLGTVQFGLPYGLARPERPVSRSEVAAVLQMAWDRGVDLLDTAPAYGDAETIIGAVKPEHAAFAIVSKTIPIRQETVGGADVERVISGVRRSLANLRVPQLDALLLHHADDLLRPGGDALFDALDRLRTKGIVRRVGVSVYDPEALHVLLDRYPLTVAQVPLNVFDQRFARDGLLTTLRARGVEIHVRSVFLQGLLLMSLERVPRHFESAHPTIANYQQAATEAGLSLPAAALRFALGCKGVARIIVGVDSLDNLRDNLAAFAQAEACDLALDFVPFAIDDPDIVDPRRWASS